MVIFDKNLLKLFPFLDRRSGLFKCIQVVHWLHKYGYDEDDVIPFQDVEHAIKNICGQDPRTIRKYLQNLVELGFLYPKSKNVVSDIKRVTHKTKYAIHPHDYITPKGYESYQFDLEALNIIRELKKQRRLDVVSPVPPSRSLGCEGVELEKYVCACSTPSEQKTSLETKERNAESICVRVEMNEENKNNEERRRSCVPHTHIFLYKDKENLTKDNLPEFQIFYAEPLKNEPDKAKISWKGDSDG